MKQEKCRIARSDILSSRTGRKCLVTLDPILGRNLFSMLKVSSYLIYICLFPLATQKGPTVRFSDCGPCAHLFMDKLHRHRWKARYSSNQKPVPCKWPQLCNFCRQLSATFLPLKSPTAFSGRWKLSINTTFIKYDPSNTWTQWRKTHYICNLSFKLKISFTKILGPRKYLKPIAHISH